MARREAKFLGGPSIPVTPSKDMDRAPEPGQTPNTGKAARPSSSTAGAAPTVEELMKQLDAERKKSGMLEARNVEMRQSMEIQHTPEPRTRETSFDSRAKENKTSRESMNGGAVVESRVSGWSTAFGAEKAGGAASKGGGAVVGPGGGGRSEAAIRKRAEKRGRSVLTPPPQI